MPAVSPALQVILDRWSRQGSEATRDTRLKILREYGRTAAGRAKIAQSCLGPGRTRLYHLTRVIETGSDNFDKPVTNWRPFIRDASTLLVAYKEFHALVILDIEDPETTARLIELIDAIQQALDECRAQPVKKAHRARLLGVLQSQVDRPPPRTLWERLDDAG